MTEDFRITVRKQLAALNKKRGYNRAAELINEQTGKGKLTEVALADLPKLMEAAKEETNAAPHRPHTAGSTAPDPSPCLSVRIPAPAATPTREQSPTAWPS